ncbi:hypothetical protein V9T40_004589 [Parthenolecanium corni]|uniref:Uncharacterized protein n=1 Tax=Parthenolecanium corni TaxID=536013 RepID=A0AAN9TUB7_9HEMI
MATLDCQNLFGHESAEHVDDDARFATTLPAKKGEDVRRANDGDGAAGGRRTRPPQPQQSGATGGGGGGAREQRVAVDAGAVAVTDCQSYSSPARSRRARPWSLRVPGADSLSPPHGAAAAAAAHFIFVSSRRSHRRDATPATDWPYDFYRVFRILAIESFRRLFFVSAVPLARKNNPHSCEYYGVRRRRRPRIVPNRSPGCLECLRPPPARPPASARRMRKITKRTRRVVCVRVPALG